MTSSTDTAAASTSTQSQSQQPPIKQEDGPYNYDLFAIMIHSGSASGGHYYAYIKDFESNEWFCFNDQTVTSITEEDIEKSFGGGSLRSYYSGAFSSSTNAYMLMYRQIDKERNCSAMKIDEFPPHITKLLQKLKDRDEEDKKKKADQLGMIKMKVYMRNPVHKQMVDTKVYMSSDSTFGETLQDAYDRFKLETICTIDRCRLVSFDSKTENIEISFEGKDNVLLNDILKLIPRTSEFLLEVREENEVFEEYLPGSILTRIYTVDPDTFEVADPIHVRCMETCQIGAYKKIISSKLQLNQEQMIVALLQFNGTARILDVDDSTISKEGVYVLSKIFVTTFKTTKAKKKKVGTAKAVATALASNTDEDDQKNELLKRFKRIVERYDHIITLFFVLPDLSRETLDKLSIPPYDETLNNINNNHALTNGRVTPTQQIIPPPPPAYLPSVNGGDSHDVVDAMIMNNPSIPQPPPLPGMSSGGGDLIGDCNSEDSSLSDGDRTLVESLPDNLNHCNLSPPTPETDLLLSSSGGDSGINSSPNTSTSSRSYYFKATEIQEGSTGDGDCGGEVKLLKVTVDKNMIMGKLKQELESIIKVPSIYFKISRLVNSQNYNECTRMTESLNAFKDGERLVIELGRILGKGEFKCKVYYLNLNDITDDTDKIPFLCDWIFKSGSNVGETKKNIVEHMTTFDAKYNIPLDKCRLRKKNFKNPAKIFLDNQKFHDDIILTQSLEVILQEYDQNSQIVDDPDDIVLFIRRWYPSKMALGPYQEVFINNKTEFKSLLSEVSGIPVDQIEYSKVSVFT